MHSVIWIKQVPESVRNRVQPLTNISARPRGDGHRSPRTALVGRGAGPARGVRRRNHRPRSRTRRRIGFLSEGIVLIRACRALRRFRIRRCRLTADQLCAGSRDPQEVAGDIVPPSLLSIASRSSIVSSNSLSPASDGPAHCSSRRWSKLGRRVSPRQRSSDRLMLDWRIGDRQGRLLYGGISAQACHARSTIGRTSRELRGHCHLSRRKREDVPTSPVSPAYADLTRAASRLRSAAIAAFARPHCEREEVAS